MKTDCTADRTQLNCSTHGPGHSTQGCIALKKFREERQKKTKVSGKINKVSEGEAEGPSPPTPPEATPQPGGAEGRGGKHKRPQTPGPGSQPEVIEVCINNCRNQVRENLRYTV